MDSKPTGLGSESVRDPGFVGVVRQREIEDLVSSDGAQYAIMPVQRVQMGKKTTCIYLGGVLGGDLRPGH